MTDKITILPPELTGTVLVTGELGIGKTTFALTCELPQNICMVDLDEKGLGIADQLGIGEYFAPTTEQSEPHRVYEAFEQWLDNLPEDKFTVAVIDNISFWEEGLKQKIKLNAAYYAERYDTKENNIRSGAYGGANTVANKIISEVIAKFRSKGIRLIIQIAHTGNKWATGGIVPGKRTIKGLSRWDTLSILSIVLIPPRPEEEQTGAPAGLVRKEQLASYVIDSYMSAEKAARVAAGEGGVIVTRRLPRRIYPCTWKQIKKYLQKPANIQSPQPHEVPLEEEIAPYEERLSKDQINYITAMAEVTALEANREQNMTAEEILQEHEKLNEIASKMVGYAGDMTPIGVKSAVIELGYACDIPLAMKVLNIIKGE